MTHQRVITADELNAAVALLSTIEQPERAQLYFCTLHTPAFVSFETDFAAHMNELHGVEDWREALIGKEAPLVLTALRGAP